MMPPLPLPRVFPPPGLAGGLVVTPPVLPGPPGPPVGPLLELPQVQSKGLQVFDGDAGGEVSD